MKNYCPKCRYFFGTTKTGKCPECDVPLENAPPTETVCPLRSPWRINRDSKDRPGVYDADGNRVADCDSSAMLSDIEKRRNAKLIADAPALLAALRRYVIANIPRPLGGIIDEDERKKAAADLAFERAEAGEWARELIIRHNV